MRFSLKFISLLSWTLLFTISHISDILNPDFSIEKCVNSQLGDRQYVAMTSQQEGAKWGKLNHARRGVVPSISFLSDLNFLFIQTGGEVLDNLFSTIWVVIKRNESEVSSDLLLVSDYFCTMNTCQYNWKPDTSLYLWIGTILGFSIPAYWIFVTSTMYFDKCLVLSLPFTHI